MWYSIVAQKQHVFDSEEVVKENRGGVSRRERKEKDVRERIEREQEEHVDGLRWMWGRKLWQPGRPASLPPWVMWEKEKWEKWLMKNSKKSHLSGVQEF